MAVEPLLSVENLVTTFKTERGKICPVDKVNFSVAPGKTLAIVGESGSGKSVTALSIMQLLPKGNGAIEGGRVMFEGEDLLKKSASEMRKVRGNRIAMIFQEPMTALNPVYTVGQQVTEVLRLHRNISRSEAWSQATEMLSKVRIPDPSDRMKNYPHELSGGMRQRVMIAMALACNPALLIADEPTTALDVTIQAQVLRLMKGLQQELGTAILFITHDLGVVAHMADDVVVMYGGRIVEYGTVQEIFSAPRHPYTAGLMASLPKMEDSKEVPLTTIKGLVPSLSDLPKGCCFADRCPKVEPRCRESLPQLLRASGGHDVACFVAQDGGASR